LQSGAQVGILLKKLALLCAELLDLFEIEFNLGGLAEELFGTHSIGAVEACNGFSPKLAAHEFLLGAQLHALGSLLVVFELFWGKF
jgi:hypothetical protein